MVVIMLVSRRQPAFAFGNWWQRELSKVFLSPSVCVHWVMSILVVLTNGASNSKLRRKNCK